MTHSLRRVDGTWGLPGGIRKHLLGSDLTCLYSKFAPKGVDKILLVKGANGSICVLRKHHRQGQNEAWIYF